MCLEFPMMLSEPNRKQEQALTDILEGMDERDDPYRLRAEDADVLAEIGRYLFIQRTKVSVRLSRSLAERALTAWERPEELDPQPLPTETAEQRAARHFAGTLGLIGLCVQERGSWVGDEVIVSLDALFVGDAYRAAHERALLQGLSSPAE